MNPDQKVHSRLFPKTKLLAISPMIFDLQASYLEYIYKTVRDSVNSDLVKRSRSQIKVKQFGFSGAVFIGLTHILIAYISAIRALRALDPAGVILELVCQPVRKYLR